MFFHTFCIGAYFCFILKPSYKIAMLFILKGRVRSVLLWSLLRPYNKPLVLRCGITAFVFTERLCFFFPKFRVLVQIILNNPVDKSCHRDILRWGQSVEERDKLLFDFWAVHFYPPFVDFGFKLAKKTKFKWDTPDKIGALKFCLKWLLSLLRGKNIGVLFEKF